jgi:putative (di)nucleoside polyphosphate hydrolase
MRFLGKDSDIRLDAHEAEFDAWKWVTREQLLRDIVAFKRPLYEAALKEFAPLFDEA